MGLAPTPLYRKRRGFDFSAAMRQLCVDLVQKTPDLMHVDLSRMLIAVSQARVRSTYGIQASLTPLRFQNGSRETVRRGRRYRIQRVVNERNEEMLYILTFYLPRFMDLDLREKFVTIFHELWHIHPDFDGDIRRHPGRCYAHSGSQKEYDAQMGVFADRYLDLSPPKELHQFLHHNFSTLAASHGGVFGLKVPRPRLIPAPV